MGWFGRQFALLAQTAKQEEPGPQDRPCGLDLLHRRIEYDAATGTFYRKERSLRDFGHCKDPQRMWRSWNSRNANQRVPLHVNRGRLFVTVDQREFSAGRAAWALAHGEFPTGLVSYLDGDQSNLKLSNLYIKGTKREKRA